VILDAWFALERPSAPSAMALSGCVGCWPTRFRMRLLPNPSVPVLATGRQPAVFPPLEVRAYSLHAIIRLPDLDRRKSDHGLAHGQDLQPLQSYGPLRRELDARSRRAGFSAAETLWRTHLASGGQCLGPAKGANLIFADPESRRNPDLRGEGAEVQLAEAGLLRRPHLRAA